VCQNDTEKELGEWTGSKRPILGVPLGFASKQPFEHNSIITKKL